MKKREEKSAMIEGTSTQKTQHAPPKFGAWRSFRIEGQKKVEGASPLIRLVDN